MDAHTQRGHITRSKQFGCLAILGKRDQRNVPMILNDNTTKMPVTEETPIFRNIDIQDIVCNGAGRAMEFNGLPEMPIRNINLKNIVIKAKKDAEFTNYENVTKENVNITIE